MPPRRTRALVEPALEGDRPVVDDRDPVADLFHLCEQVARVEDGDAGGRQAGHERAEVADACGVEAVPRLSSTSSFGERISEAAMPSR